MRVPTGPRNWQQLEILLAASQDPETLVATPNRLLEAHPGLRRLKEGLVDAQLRVAELMGKMNESHPDVKAALTEEAEIQQDLLPGTRNLHSRTAGRSANHRSGDSFPRKATRGGPGRDWTSWPPFVLDTAISSPKSPTGVTNCARSSGPWPKRWRLAKPRRPPA